MYIVSAGTLIKHNTRTWEAVIKLWQGKFVLKRSSLCSKFSVQVKPHHSSLTLTTIRLISSCMFNIVQPTDLVGCFEENIAKWPKPDDSNEKDSFRCIYFTFWIVSFTFWPVLYKTLPYSFLVNKHFECSTLLTFQSFLLEKSFLRCWSPSC